MIVLSDTSPIYYLILEICGGTFVNEPCVIDGNLISGRTYHDHGHCIDARIKLLNAE